MSTLCSKKRPPYWHYAGRANKAASSAAGSATEEAATCKSAKYLNIQTYHTFQPISVESLGPINASDLVFLSKLGRTSFLAVGRRQRNHLFISATLRFDSAVQCLLLHDSFVKERRSKVQPSLIFVLFVLHSVIIIIIIITMSFYTL